MKFHVRELLVMNASKQKIHVFVTVIDHHDI